jgi:hypothetical protein
MALMGTIPLEHTLDSDLDSDEDAVAFDGQGRASGAPFESQYSEHVTIDTRIQYTAPSRSNNADLVDFRMAGPDPSVGDPKSIHGVSINITKDVRGLSCPKGTTQEMQTYGGGNPGRSHLPR